MSKGFAYNSIPSRCSSVPAQLGFCCDFVANRSIRRAVGFFFCVGGADSDALIGVSTNHRLRPEDSGLSEANGEALAKQVQFLPDTFTSVEATTSAVDSGETRVSRKATSAQSSDVGGRGAHRTDNKKLRSRSSLSRSFVGLVGNTLERLANAIPGRRSVLSIPQSNVGFPDDFAAPDTVDREPFTQLRVIIAYLPDLFH